MTKKHEIVVAFLVLFDVSDVEYSYLYRLRRRIKLSISFQTSNKTIYIVSDV